MAGDEADVLGWLTMTGLVRTLPACLQLNCSERNGLFSPSSLYADGFGTLFQGFLGELFTRELPWAFASVTGKTI